MNPDAMITTLKALKLHGMADAIHTLSDQSSPAYEQAIPVHPGGKLFRRSQPLGS